jgi:hypothetical protein
MKYQTLICSLIIGISFSAVAQKAYVQAVATNQFCRAVLAVQPLTLQAIKDKQTPLSEIHDAGFRIKIAGDAVVRSMETNLSRSDMKALYTEPQFSGPFPFQYTTTNSFPIYRTNLLLVTLSVSNFITKEEKVVWHLIGPSLGVPDLDYQYYRLHDMVLDGNNLHMFYEHERAACLETIASVHHNERPRVGAERQLTVPAEAVTGAQFVKTNGQLMAHLQVIQLKKAAPIKEELWWRFDSNSSKWVKMGPLDFLMLNHF